MRRKITGIAAAFVMALLGTFMLAAYVQSAKNNAAAAEDTKVVFVVNKPIAKGQSLESGLFRREKVPTRLTAEDAVTRLEDLKGQVALIDLRPGDQAVKARFGKPESLQTSVAPPDKLEVTIPVDPARAVGGRLRPGDKVAVVTSFDPQDGMLNITSMILHKVLVTNVQTDTAPKTSKKADEPAPKAGDKASGDTLSKPQVVNDKNLLVTLALDAHSVERVVFAAEHGFIWLALDPEKAPEGGTRIVTIADYAVEILKDPRFTDPNAPWNKQR